MRTATCVACLLAFALVPPARAVEEDEEQEVSESEEREEEEERREEAEEKEEDARERKEEERERLDEERERKEEEARERKEEERERREEEAQRQIERAEEHAKRLAAEAQEAAHRIEREVREKVEKILAESKNHAAEHDNARVEEHLKRAATEAKRAAEKLERQVRGQVEKILADSRAQAAKMIRQADEQLRMLLKEGRAKGNLFEEEAIEKVLRKGDKPRGKGPGKPDLFVRPPGVEGFEWKQMEKLFGAKDGPEGFQFHLDPRGRSVAGPGEIEELRREVRELGKEIGRIEKLIQELHRAMETRRDRPEKGPPERKRDIKLDPKGSPGDLELPPKPDLPAPDLKAEEV